jgi:autotransporter-associated beta strand protein
MNKSLIIHPVHRVACLSFVTAALSVAGTVFGDTQYFSPASAAKWDPVNLPNWSTLAGVPGSYTNAWTNGNIACFEIGGGVITVSNNPVAGGIVFSSTLTLTPGIGGVITLTNTPVIDTTNASATINASLAGDVGFTKIGSGTLTLGASNSYSGGTVISAGTLLAATNSVLNTNLVATALGTGAITLGDADTGTNAVSFILKGAGGGANFGLPIVVSTNGSGPATIAVNNTATGGLNCTNKITLNRDATLQSSSAFLILTAGSGLAGAGNLTLSGGSLKFTVPNPGWTGNLTIASGATAQSGVGSSPTVDFIPDTCSVTNNGKLNLSAQAETIGGLNGNGSVTMNGSVNGILTVGGGNASGEFDGVISNSATKTIGLGKTGAGTQVLTGVNTYTGPTTVSNGVLMIGGAGQLGAGSYAGPITNNATLDFDSSAAQTLSGVISGTGTLVQSGSGLLTLSGANSYTGNTIINAGTLELAQSVPALSPSSTVLVTNGALLQLDSATVTNQVAGLVLNGVSQAPGVYNSVNASPYITGPGSMQVVPAGPSGPAYLTNSVSGGNLSLTWPAGQGWRLVSQTNSVSTGLSTNWSTVTGHADGSFNTPLDPSKPAVFFKLAYP